MARILIAGEPGELLTVLEAELEGQGHDVTVAASGQEAYELALEEKPDAVILTAQMPVFDGLTTCRMLRDDPDVPSDLPVFLVSGTDVDVKAVERAGVTKLVGARHEDAELRELLARHLGESLWL
jgi:CheY-like chemotaxis protein